MIKSYKGVREATIATFSLALGFLLMQVGNSFQVKQELTGVVSNTFIIGGFLLFYLAICRFTGMPTDRRLAFGFVPLGYLMLILAWLFNLRSLPMIYITAAITFMLNMATALTLYRSNTRRYRLAAYLTGLPLSIYGLIVLGRIVVGFFNPREIAPGPSLSAISEVMALFIFSYLWSSGFILMVSQRLQSDLNDLAMNDALTRVRNRRAMKEMLDFEMNRVDQEVRDFSIILLDVDHFKRVNDTYGHDIGDSVLQWLASTMQRNMRIQDVVARWGGEEFMILLPDTSLEEAMQIAERLRKIIEKSDIEIPSGTLQITFSAGVSCSTSSRVVSQLCKVADQALYLAKETRNRVVSQDKIPVEEIA